MQVSNSRQTERTPKSQKHCKQWGGVTRSTEVWRPSPSTIYLLGTMAGSPRRLATADHVAMDPETGMPHTRRANHRGRLEPADAAHGPEVGPVAACALAARSPGCHVGSHRDRQHRGQRSVQCSDQPVQVSQHCAPLPPVLGLGETTDRLRQLDRPLSMPPHPPPSFMASSGSLPCAGLRFH